MNPSPSRFLQWLRWPNLVIVSFTLAFIRYGLIAPALEREGLFPVTDTFSFVLLTLYTLIITFSGYVINDLYDQKTDAQNKPQKLAIGVWISETRARAIYIALIAIGATLALYLDWRTGWAYWTGIYLVLVYLLWLYSRHLKGSVLSGNLLVSLLCAAVVWIVPLAEKAVLTRLEDTRQIMQILFFYTAFAGISNLLREIIKDAEDVAGDAKSGLNTLAVVYGSGMSKKVAIGVAGILSVLICVFYLQRGQDWGKMGGFLLCTLPFLLFVFIGLLKKTERINWKILSRSAKLLMLGGLLGLLFLL